MNKIARWDTYGDENGPDPHEDILADLLEKNKIS